MHMKGFTLVELLVTISIVAIIALVASVLFGGVAKSANDATRFTDVGMIAKAFEAHYDPSSGIYPGVVDSWFTSGVQPVDPNGSNYLIQYSSGNTGFRVCAALDSHIGGVSNCEDDDPTCSCKESTQGRFVAAASPSPSPIPTASPPLPSPSPSEAPLPSPSPVLCTITSALWGTSSETEGVSVTLTVTGTNECLGKTADFVVKEDDVSFGEDVGDDNVLINPSSVTFVTNTVNRSWVAEWQSDCGGFCNPPEYYFDATVVGESTMRSGLLTVTQAPPPNQPPSCVSEPTGPASLNTSQAGVYTSTATDPDSNITGYNWTTSPSSGTPTSQNNVTSTFNWTAPGTSGSVNINLTVTDAGSLQATCPAKTITIIAPSPSPTPTPSPSPSSITIDFESPPVGALNGQYPTGVINWGSTGQWQVGGPYQAMTTKNVWYSSGTSKTFTFVTPRKVVSVLVHTDIGSSSTITLNCPGNFLVSQVVGSNALVTITTNWTNNCTGAVTVGSSAGGDSEFDNLVVQ